MGFVDIGTDPEISATTYHHRGMRSSFGIFKALFLVLTDIRIPKSRDCLFRDCHFSLIFDTLANQSRNHSPTIRFTIRLIGSKANSTAMISGHLIP